jgi:hypothetical protein
MTEGNFSVKTSVRKKKQTSMLAIKTGKDVVHDVDDWIQKQIKEEGKDLSKFTSIGDAYVTFFKTEGFEGLVGGLHHLFDYVWGNMCFNTAAKVFHQKDTNFIDTVKEITEKNNTEGSKSGESGSIQIQQLIDVNASEASTSTTSHKYQLNLDKLLGDKKGTEGFKEKNFALEAFVLQFFASSKCNMQFLRSIIQQFQLFWDKGSMSVMEDYDVFLENIVGLTRNIANFLFEWINHFIEVRIKTFEEKNDKTKKPSRFLKKYLDSVVNMVVPGMLHRLIISDLLTSESEKQNGKSFLDFVKLSHCMKSLIIKKSTKNGSENDGHQIPENIPASLMEKVKDRV